MIHATHTLGRSRDGAGRAASTSFCARCRRALAGGSGFVLGGLRRCLGCTLRHPPLLRRSAITALVVGSLLVAINQGTVLASGAPPASLLWQIPLTYAVPFGVATWGALVNSRVAPE
ncbi:MAG: nitrate/nitrite transporter NrtS [Chloroflexi bacterium]|nr:nitrate/nitrite transporter NrtS [Chloroflexota bacterium]